MPIYDARQRREQIRDKLRTIGLHVPLSCDGMFEKGWLSEPQWLDLHCFRYDQVMLRDKEFMSGGRAHGARPKGSGRTGFRMPNFGITRAEACRDMMDPHCYRVAMILVGLEDGEAERMEAVNAAWQVGQVYRGNGGLERWRD